ncbi:MAG: VanW family protein [Clostridia bacterium]|nr:VanW family protein [Clostridia bacterium]
MKKYLWIIVPIILVAIMAIIYIITKENFNKENDSYSTEKLSAKQNIDNTSKQDSSDDAENNNANENSGTTEKKEPVETEIATFTTKIKSVRDTNRQTNISLACNTLNDTIVNPGETFSFCNTVGKATEEKGYKEANIFVNGEETKGLGGGKCQISSTLYNAVLACPDLEVVERHAHSAPVTYVEEGKDAAISYGVHDFKFKNNFSEPIKIIATNTNNEINIRLLKLS